MTLANASVSVFRILGRGTDPYDALEVIGADITNGHAIFSGETLTLPGHVDMAGTRVLYLSSSNFGHYNSLGPRGESDILRAIYLDQPFGSYISDRLTNPFEHIEVGGSNSRVFAFEIYRTINDD